MRINPVIVLRCFLCLMSVAFNVGAQQDQDLSAYRLQHFTDENGLPQNSVKGVMEDKNGFIWLATEVGVVRFDGQKFVTFDKSNLPVSSNRIRGFVPALPARNADTAFEFYGLTEDNQYIGILNNGLTAVDTVFYQKYRQIDPYTGKQIRHNSMLGSLPSQYPITPLGEHYFAASDSRTFFIWRGKAIFCYKNSKLVYTNPGSFKEFFLIGKNPYAFNFSGQIIKIGSSAPQNAFFPEGDIEDNPLYSKGKYNYQLYWNNISKSAFLYLNKCFYTLEESSNGRLTTRLIFENYDFAQLDIVAAHYNKINDALFLGSATKGFFLIRNKNFRTLKMAENDADNAYYAQKPAANLSVITGQGYQLGLNAARSEVVGNRISKFMEDFNYKFSLAINPDSSFWFGIGFNLFRLDKTARNVLVHLKLKENVKSFFVDKQHRIWVGGANNTLYKMEGSNGQYQMKLVLKAALGGVSILAQETKDVLFIGGTKGLFRYNVSTGNLQKLTNFNNMNIRSFYTTSDGTWITTYGNGMFLLKNNKLIQLPLDKDRFLATAHCITEDAKGFFWITTNRGLFQAAKQQLLDFAKSGNNVVYYLYYERSQGFSTNEFNGGCQPCAVRLADGTVSVPSMDGLVWFAPDKIRPELPSKGIFVSAASIDGTDIQVKDTLDISREFEQLRLQVTTPYLGHPKNIHMHYSLSGEGRAEKWFPVNADFTIPIPKLPCGVYKLTIRKVNGFKTKDYTYKSTTLRIPPAWFETWWFRSVLVFLTLALFFMAVRWRTGYLLKKERKDNLVRHYRVISQIVAAVNHDIQTPLHYIGYSLRQINAYLHKQENSNPLITRMSDESLNTSERIGALTKNLLDYIKIQNKNSSSRTQMGRVEVREMVANISELFAAIARFRDVTVRNEVEPDFTVWSDLNLLSIVIHNLLDNALKISASEITISAGFENGKKQIVIEDSGSGMPEDLIKWLNKSYRSYEEWLKISLYPEQKGIGLVIVKDLCVLLRIDIIASINSKSHTIIRLVFEPRKDEA